MPLLGDAVASDEGLAGGAMVEEVDVVVAGVVWNGFHHVGDQVLPLQPVIATTDNRANAPRAIELRMFWCPLKGTRSRPRGASTSLSLGPILNPRP